MTIHLHRTTTGWTATFTGGDMPNGVQLPLPWTAAASEVDVTADIRRRFPNAHIRVQL